MKFLLAAAFVAVASASLSFRDQMARDRVVRLSHTAGQLSELQQSKAREVISRLDVWGTAEDGSLEVRVPFDMVSAFDALGFNVTDATQEHEDHFNWMAEHRDEQVCQKSAKECASAPDFYTRYQRLAAIHERLSQLQNRRPTLVSSLNWGQSTENRNQMGVSVTGTGGGGNKPIVFYFCGEHAREWLPPMFCTSMAENLADLYAQGDARIVRIMDAFQFDILPVMNPDGYEWSHTNANMWRKSRKLNPGDPFGCIGTDLNRNYAYQWNTGGSSGNPCMDTYHGVQPFDNPETANLATYTRARNLVIQTDVHAYGRMWMHPWGYTRTLSPDNNLQQRSGDATVAAIAAVHGQRFAAGSIANVIYVASGSSCDWFYGDQGVIYAYAPEVRGNSFQPNANQIIPSNEELWAGMLAQVETAMITPY